MSDQPTNHGASHGALVPVQEASDMVRLTIARRSVRFVGNPDDPYFQNLPAFFHDLPNIEAYVRRHLPGDAICLDVGANLGLTAVLLSLLCPDGHVYAFEALPRNAEFLRANLRLNGIGNCTVINTAVGAERGVLSFTDSGAGSHVVTEAHLDRANRQTVSVPVTPLDDVVLSELRLPRLDFVKMDVEGFEPPALAGAARLIERFRPPIFMEFNAWSLAFAHGFSPFSFAKTLFESFDVFDVEEDGALRSLQGETANGFLHRNMVQEHCVSDVLMQLRSEAVVPPLDEMTGRASTREAREAAARVAELTERAEVAEARVAEMEWQVEAATAHAAGMDRHVEALAARAAELARQAEAAEASATRAQGEIEAIRLSGTWRALEPYRRFRNALGQRTPR